MPFNTPSVSEIVKDQIFLGNLSAAQSIDLLENLHITHVLSICPESPSLPSRFQHICIPVQDSEYEDLLIHLPKTCHFIERAVEENGRVLVHCVMGISRSSTVVAGYLMKTYKMSAPDALRRIKNKRPQVHPNYGFTKQLDTFKKCDFAPSPSDPTYRSWKKKCEQDISFYLGHVRDTVEIIQDKVLLCSEFPSDTQQARSFLQDLGVTHLLSISPAEISIDAHQIVKHHHIRLDSSKPNEGLLLALPGVCDWISRSLNEDDKDGVNSNLVLIHSLVESRACIAACAYLMKLRKQSAAQAFRIIEDALPLFTPTRNFTQNLELFQACRYQPTADHPKVKEWVSSQRGTNRRLSEFDANGSGMQSDLAMTARNLLSETGYDLKAFAEAMNAIHIRS